MYLSWFSLSKVFRLAKPVSKATFSTITTEVADLDRILEVCSELKSGFQDILHRYCPWVTQIPIEQGISWIPTWKLVPNLDRDRKVVPSIFPSLTYELSVYGTLVQLLN